MAEDFTNYTEEDPEGQVNIDSADTISWSDFDRCNSTYIVKDKSVASGEYFEVKVTIKIDSQTGWWPKGYFWALATDEGDEADIKDNNENQIGIFVQTADDEDNAIILTEIKDGSVENEDFYYNSDILGGGPWYVTIKREGDTLSAEIYDDSGRDNLLDTISFTLSSNESYSYMYATQGMHDDGGGCDGVDGSVEDMTFEMGVVETKDATNIDTDSAQLNGTLNSLEGNSDMDVYFEWGEDDSYGNTTDTQTLSDTGDFDDTIDGLSDDTEYHYRAVATDGTDTWYGDDVSFTTDFEPSPITDFNKSKKLDVESVTDTPTISRTVPLKITGNDDSTTGTGEIELDWTNISSESDIGVYDENGNLLDYYFESFDDTNETAVIWVYRDWVRDGSTQAQIAYGDGPSDQSVSADTVFDKESDLEAGYLLNEDSGDALDVTSNNNDGTVNGGVTQGGDGIVDGAYEFDGSDGKVNTTYQDELDNITLVTWIKSNQGQDYGKHTGAIYGADGWDADGFSFYLRLNNDSGAAFAWNINGNYIREGNVDEGEWQFIVGTYDGSESELFLDGNSIGTTSASGTVDMSEVVRFGGDNDGSLDGHLDAFLDGTFIYSSALSSDDRTALYDSTKSSPDFFSQQAGESTEEEYIPKVIMVN